MYEILTDWLQIIIDHNPLRGLHGSANNAGVPGSHWCRMCPLGGVKWTPRYNDVIIICIINRARQFRLQVSEEVSE